MIRGSNDDALSAVSCRTERVCIAVGSFDSAGGDGASSALAERWNGSRWVLLRAQNHDSEGDDEFELSGVSCSSRRDCVAVGESDIFQSDGQAPLVERWNGSTWTLAERGLQSASDVALTAVVCISTRSCTAVGADGFGITSLRWNGHKWSSKSSSARASLDGLSCSSSRTCMAVGTGPGPFALRLVGSQPVVEPTPSVAPASSWLNAVSCVSPVACMAVGSSLTAGGTEVALAEWWNGTSWTIEPTLTPRIQTSLLGVACASPDWCVAVGSSGSAALPGYSSTTLAENWNGVAWTVQSTPNPIGVPNDALNAVSCSSSSACTAVGAANESSALIERWDGLSWTLSPAPAPEPGGNGDRQLTAVSCSAISRCVAVGSSPSSAEWDGMTWTALPTPNPGAGNQTLTGISCGSPTACVAVGPAPSGGGQIDVLNGTTWSAQSSGPPATAVSCPGPSACTTVGDAPGGGATAHGWDGQRWTAQTGLNFAASSVARLTDVSCSIPTECVAVGRVTPAGDTGDSPLEDSVAEHYG
jgi:hypothetical protein